MYVFFKTKTKHLLCCRSFKKEYFLKKSHIWSYFVQLKSFVFNLLCVSDFLSERCQSTLFRGFFVFRLTWVFGWYLHVVLLVLISERPSARANGANCWRLCWLLSWLKYDCYSRSDISGSRCHYSRFAAAKVCGCKEHICSYEHRSLAANVHFFKDRFLWNIETLIKTSDSFC